MKKKKILIVMMNLYNGGAEKSLVNLLNEIDYSKYKIDLLLFQQKGLFLKQIPNNVNLIEPPNDLFLLYNNPSLKNLVNLKNLRQIFLRYYYSLFVNLTYRDVIPREKKQIRWDKYYKNNISNFDKKYDIALSYLENEPMRYVIDKVFAEKKYVWLHNDYKKLGLNKKYDDIYYKKADKIVTISNECLKVFNQSFPKYKDKTIYIPNISSERVIKKLASLESNIKFDEDKFKIISIGRLSNEKGFDLAVDAAKILKENNVNYQWFIIGDGIMKHQIEKKIKEYKLEKFFFLIGTTDNPYSYISAADILVQPSRFEGKSMVLDEAKILCKPFVVTKYPTVYDQANENIAVIVDINANAIANGVTELYNNKHKINEMKNNLKETNFSNEGDIKKYYKLFDE